MFKQLLSYSSELFISNIMYYEYTEKRGIMILLFVIPSMMCDIRTHIVALKWNTKCMKFSV